MDCPPVSSPERWLSASARTSGRGLTAPSRWRRLLPAVGYAVAAAVAVTALALLAREQVGAVITFDKNAPFSLNGPYLVPPSNLDTPKVHAWNVS